MKPAPHGPFAPSPRIWHHAGQWELRDVSDSAACYAPHVHDTFSLGQIVAGASQCLIDGCVRPIAAGAAVRVRAGDVHACNPDPGRPWSYRMLHVDPAWLARLALNEPASGLQPDAPGIHDGFQQLVAALERQDSVLAIDEILYRLLRPLAPALPPPLREQPHQVGRACDYLHEHACDAVDLATLADLAGLSPWQLIRAVRRQTGLTPHALQLNLRIQRARVWLREGMAPADAAQQAGFADQSHFTRQFKRQTALTPGVYRQALRTA
ncbi:MAG: AraC family transcriptional regulator [Microvirgula sp.]